MASLIQFFREIGPVKLSIIGGVILFLIIGIILFTIKSSVKEYIPLYSNLDISDSDIIVNELESKNIPFQLRSNGSEILVPEDKVLRLRMSMAQQNIPSKGSIVGYEIFDNSEFLGTSNFVQNVNLLRALEGELARTIASFSNITSARVHLVMPKRELFTREKQIPSASIIIGMKGGNTLSKEQINAISNLVATAVPNLDIEKITIVDTKGRSLKSGSKSNEISSIITNNEEFKTSYENRLKNVVESLIEQSVGIGHVKVQIAAEMNFDRIITNSEIYDPSGQVVRSTQEIDDKESSNEKESDNVSLANNIPNAQSNQDNKIQASNNSSHADTTTNYEISKTIKNQISETGTIKKLSIAVLIDGYYKTDEKTKETTYTPRTDDEIQKYSNLVKSAVGFDDSRGDKIEIINMQFTTDLSIFKQESNTEWIKSELPNLIKTLIIAIVVILILLLIVRPIAMRAFESTKVDLNETNTDKIIIDSTNESISTETTEVNNNENQTDNFESKFKSNSNVKLVNDIIEKHPDETLGTFRKWMNKE